MVKVEYFDVYFTFPFYAIAKDGLLDLYFEEACGVGK